jgi:hypothetical protein
MSWKKFKENQVSHKTSEYVNNLFEQPWWLDAVAPDSWKEIIVEEGGKVVARWPVVTRWYGIGMPDLTQGLGFWISDNELVTDYHNNRKKRITNLLLDQLPKHKSINISLNPKADYFLPMYWKNYVIAPKITYRINDLTDLTSVFNKFGKELRRKIKIAENQLTVESIDDIEILLVLMDKTFALQNRKYPVSKDLIRNLYNSCKDNNACNLLYATDDEGNVHAGILFVYDKNICYSLIGGTDPSFRKSNAFSLLDWEGIKFASTVSESYDFLGSMVEGIEHYARQFAGTPTVYYQIRKQNIALELFELLKPMIKSFIGYKK